MPPVWYSTVHASPSCLRSILSSDKTESEGTELMEFIGRTEERRRIRRALAEEGGRTILVYGRRRVGKSELIKQCLREVPADGLTLYYECRQTSEMDNVESLSALVSQQLGMPPLAFGSMEGLLEFLFRSAAGQPVTLVLDEYPYLRQGVRGLDSILQSLIDRHRDTSRMHLVLCGSFVDVMRLLLGRSNPLYGRVDVTVDLKPMDYYDSALFYPSFSEEDRVRLFSVFGGIPYYNRLIDSGLSVRENIIELIASQGARLENEVSLYLGSEISKISNANEVFGALSQGYSRYKDILAQSHVSSGPTMVDVLDKLIRMELVQKQAPINDPGNRRRVAYRIVDGLSLFYYRYVFRYASQLSVMNPEAFFDRFVADDFEHRYVPVAFEEVCRQYLVRQNRAGMLEEPFDLIGRYSYDDPVAHKNGEFDVVTHDSRGYAFYECKFRRTPVSRQMVSEEIAQVEQAGLSCYKYGFFSRSGFDCAPEANQVFIGLSRLFE